MDIQNLRYFMTVCNYRSMTKAAEILHISQPALSRKIIALEEELGVQLLIRKKYIELTPAGEQLIAAAQDIIAREEDLKSQMELFQKRGKIRIGYSYGMFTQLLYEIVYKCSKSEYRDKLQFKSMPSAQCIRNLENDLIDIAYSIIGEIEVSSDIDIVTLRDNTLAIIVPRDHRLWHKPFVTWADIEGETLIVTVPSYTNMASAAPIADYIRKNAPGTNLIATACNNTEKVLMVCAGAGLGVTGMHGEDIIQAQSDYYKKIMIKDSDTKVGDVVMVYKKDNENAAEFVRYVKSVL